MFLNINAIKCTRNHGINYLTTIDDLIANSTNRVQLSHVIRRRRKARKKKMKSEFLCHNFSLLRRLYCGGYGVE